MQVSYGGLLVRWSMQNPAFRRSLRSVGRNGSVNDDNGSTWKLRFFPLCAHQGPTFPQRRVGPFEAKGRSFSGQSTFFMFSFAHAASLPLYHLGD